MNRNGYLTFINQDQYTATILDNIIKYYTITNRKEDYDPCEHCSNHPRNGGSGICHCILGLRNQVTC